MIKHIWSILCRESKIEMDTNNISIIDAYESLQFDLKLDLNNYDSTKPIAGPFTFEVVSLFYRDKKGTQEVLDLSIIVLDPKGNELGKFPAKIEFQKEHNRMRSRMKFDTIALTTSGTYIFQVYTQKTGSSKRDLAAAIPVDIKIVVNDKER